MASGLRPGDLSHSSEKPLPPTRPLPVGTPYLCPKSPLRMRHKAFPELFRSVGCFRPDALGKGSGRKCLGGSRGWRWHVGVAPTPRPGAPWGAGGLRARPRPPEAPEQAVIQEEPSHRQGEGHQVGSGGVPEAAESGPPAGEPEIDETETSDRRPKGHLQDPSPKPRQKSQGPTSLQAREGEAPGHSIHRRRLPQVPGGIFWESWNQVMEREEPWVWTGHELSSLFKTAQSLDLSD